MTGRGEARGSGPVSLIGGRPGPIRRALEAMVAEARGSQAFSLEDEVRVLLAVRYAALVDRMTSAGNGAAVTKAGDKLLEVLDTLPVARRAPAPTEGGTSSGDHGDGERGQLLRILDSPPTVGDAAHP